MLAITASSWCCTRLGLTCVAITISVATPLVVLSQPGSIPKYLTLTISKSNKGNAVFVVRVLASEITDYGGVRLFACVLVMLLPTHNGSPGPRCAWWTASIICQRTHKFVIYIDIAVIIIYQ
jgi:hypothetical protein